MYNIVYNDISPSMDDLTIETYNKIAEKYAETHWDTHSMDKQYCDFINFLNGKRLLDAGCGPGRDTRYFLSKGYRVTSIDKSKGMLAEAQKRVAGGDFREMDMLKLKFRAKVFDGIWCCASLLHIRKSDAARVLTGFNKILKDKGILFLSLKMGRGERIVTYPDGNRRFFSYYSEKEIVELVERNFKVLKVSTQSEKQGDVWVNVFAQKA